MRNFKSMRLIPLILVISLISVVNSSCKDDHEPTPDYAGKWITEKPVAVATGYTSIKYYIELKNNEFTETFIRPSRTPYENSTQLTLEGTISASGKTLKLVIHKLSVLNYNSATCTVSAPYETHTYNDDDFGFEFEGSGLSTSNHQVEYNLIDGKLILKVDYNRNGIYSEDEKSMCSIV
jgi:hypothetical protein